MGSPPAAAISLPQLKYQLPEGWQEKPPSEMRVASFTALGPNGQSADVSVIPLPIVGRDLELVNMWRSQVQLPATSDPNAVKQAEPVAIGAEQGRLFDFVSEQPMIGKARQRILVAMLTRGTMSWFFKMTGEDAFVDFAKGKFSPIFEIDFVRGKCSGANGRCSAQLKMKMPIRFGQFRPTGSRCRRRNFCLAEFSITGTNGAKADVNVAEMGGEGGGLLANVNRWRGQLGLPPIDEK